VLDTPVYLLVVLQPVYNLSCINSSICKSCGLGAVTTLAMGVRCSDGRKSELDSRGEWITERSFIDSSLVI